MKAEVPFGLPLSDTSTIEHILGKSLLLPRFFFVLSSTTVDTIVVLELVLMDELTSVVGDLFLCEFESILLKY